MEVIKVARMFTRMIRAAKLDPELYEEVEADESAFSEALVVVALSGVATMAGLAGRLNLRELISGLVLGILAWSGWSALVFFVGTRVCPEPQTRADWGELLRTTGFATTPALLSILGIFPVLAGFITIVASVWILLAFGVAVRQALDYHSTLRAVAVCFVGWVVYTGILFSLMPRV